MDGLGAHRRRADRRQVGLERDVVDPSGGVGQQLRQDRVLAEGAGEVDRLVTGRNGRLEHHPVGEQDAVDDTPGQLRPAGRPGHAGEAGAGLLEPERSPFGHHVRNEEGRGLHLVRREAVGQADDLADGGLLAPEAEDGRRDRQAVAAVGYAVDQPLAGPQAAALQRPGPQIGFRQAAVHHVRGAHDQERVGAGRRAQGVGRRRGVRTPHDHRDADRDPGQLGEVGGGLPEHVHRGPDGGQHGRVDVQLSEGAGQPVGVPADGVVHAGVGRRGRIDRHLAGQLLAQPGAGEAEGGQVREGVRLGLAQVVIGDRREGRLGRVVAGRPDRLGRPQRAVVVEVGPQGRVVPGDREGDRVPVGAHRHDRGAMGVEAHAADPAQLGPQLPADREDRLLPRRRVGPAHAAGPGGRMGGAGAGDDPSVRGEDDALGGRGAQVQSQEGSHR